MTDRERAFESMKRGSIDGVLGTGTSIYGVDIDTMNHDETRIALGWALSQAARVLGPGSVGVRAETRQ